MKFFIIDDNTIVNLILAETKEIAERVTGLTAIKDSDAKVKNASIGYVYNPETKKYEAPETE